MNSSEEALHRRGRRILLGYAAFIASCVIGFWLWFIVPAKRDAAFYRATKAEFQSLAKKRPPNITRNQWHHIVAWTLNAHANCFSVVRSIPQEEREQFLKELRERLQSDVDLATIDWIWDELVRLTSYGQTYSERWRPTSPEKLLEFEADGIIWAGVYVD
jgi:hypothetical protein